MKQLKANVKKESLGDPQIDTFLVELENADGIWIERYTRHDLDMFLEGVRAGCAMSGTRLAIIGL